MGCMSTTYILPHRLDPLHLCNALSYGVYSVYEDHPVCTVIDDAHHRSDRHRPPVDAETCREETVGQTVDIALRGLRTGRCRREWWERLHHQITLSINESWTCGTVLLRSDKARRNAGLAGELVPTEGEQ